MARSPREHDPRITVIQRELFDESKSQADKYRDLFIGRPGFGALVLYELVMICASWVPGALGLFLRSKCIRGFSAASGGTSSLASTSRCGIRTRFESGTMS